LPKKKKKLGKRKGGGEKNLPNKGADLGEYRDKISSLERKGKRSRFFTTLYGGGALAHFFLLKREREGVGH